MKNEKFSKFVLFLNQKTNYTFGTWIIRAPKVPFNFHFKTGMEKAIFMYFNFDSKLKIQKRQFFFQFLIFNFYSKIEKQNFRFPFFKFHFILKQ